jgi:hypothetical protein
MVDFAFFNYALRENAGFLLNTFKTFQALLPAELKRLTLSADYLDKVSSCDSGVEAD